MTMNKLLTGPWNLTDLKNIKPNGLKVFSCFHCGGGSTMGYKLSGYEVLGGVEIDPQMMEIYKLNHNPKHSYLMGVQDFKHIPDNELPRELFELDILDGSPPCSSFSMAGSREDAWGENKKFREGQAHQVLDDLFFDFIDIAKKLQPKVVVAENVKGLVIGKAKGYVKEIFKKFNEAGYSTQLFLLNSSRMGVPQKRERTFFIARRKDLELPQIKLEFNEDPISVEKAFLGIDPLGKELTEEQLSLWKKCLPGKPFSSVHPKGHWFQAYKLNKNLPCTTITATGGNSEPFHWSVPRKVSDAAGARLQSFPDDYNFRKLKPIYVIGMSVPPFMMQRVADQIQKQLFSNQDD